MLVAGHGNGGARRPPRRAGVAGAARRRAGLRARLAENRRRAGRRLAGGYSHIVFPATARQNVAPRVAALLDVAQVR